MTAAPSLLGSVRVTLPLKTITEGNAKENWRTSYGRAKRQRAMVAKVLPWHIVAAGWYRPACGCVELPPGGVTVTVTRIAPGVGLDPHDNLPSSQKHVVDEITKQLGLKDDRSTLVSWAYAQQRGSPKDLTLAKGYGVEIRVETRGAC